VSALTGSGIDALKQMLFDEAGASFGERGAHLLITNVRQRDALVKAAHALARAGQCAESDGTLPFLAFELKDALRYLGEITGETCAPDVLDEIFSRFCIGK
jgi:tRNA modification GTPase